MNKLNDKSKIPQIIKYKGNTITEEKNIAFFSQMSAKNMQTTYQKQINCLRCT